MITHCRRRDAQIVVAIERYLRLVHLTRLNEAGRVLLEQLLDGSEALRTYQRLHARHGAHVAWRRQAAAALSQTLQLAL